jgi:hypothetical protein
LDKTRTRDYLAYNEINPPKKHSHSPMCFANFYLKRLPLSGNPCLVRNGPGLSQTDQITLHSRNTPMNWWKAARVSWAEGSQLHWFELVCEMPLFVHACE